jgi:gentisate 1,2-dioxygenase
MATKEEEGEEEFEEAEIGYVSEETYESLEDRHLRTMWDVHDQWGKPETDANPHKWSWDEVKESLYDVESEMSFDDVPQGIRRSLALCAPGYDMTSETVAVFFQLVTAGEESGAHRHNVSAFRFVVEGDPEMYTVVEGEAFPMERGDLVLTPNWTWHDHVNESDSDAIWIDVLDWPFVGNGLKSPVFEQFKDYRQAVDKDDGFFNSQFGRMRPSRDPDSEFKDAPPYRFAYEDAYESLEQSVADEKSNAFDPNNGYNMEYVNPATGEPPVLATTALRLQRVEADMDLARHRHNSMEFYYVMEGEGRTEVGEETIEWEAKDSFVVPRGYWHEHDASEDATLFVTSDKPIFDSFHLHREEGAEDEHLL